MMLIGAISLWTVSCDMSNDVNFTYNSCILFYCIHERAVQRRNVRERKSRRVREREHVKEGSWIADYVYEGIQETLGV